MPPSRPSSSGMVGSSRLPASRGAIPRPSAQGWWNCKARTTWIPAAREKRGGRKRLIAIDPAIEVNFHKVLEDHTAGDPMRVGVKWTNLSRRQIARRITKLGTPVSRHVASQLLKKHGYRRR